MLEFGNFTETQKQEIIKSMVILIDTREQKVDHITKFFDEQGIAYKKQKLEFGDYTFLIPANEELGIMYDMSFRNEISIERKASANELIMNFIQDRNRLKAEFHRAKGRFMLLIEDTSYKNLALGNYISKIQPKAVIASLHSITNECDVPYIFLDDRNYTGMFIYFHFYHYLRNIMK